MCKIDKVMNILTKIYSGESRKLEKNEATGKTTLSIEEANKLVEENQGWGESIARSVARAWNLDWQNDGLDGAAMEALIFCARRYDPTRGVPFRGYARKRIHEASSEAARKSKGWRKAVDPARAEFEAREISAELLSIFPELRSGQLPLSDEASGDDSEDVRGAIRSLLVGASLVAVKQGFAAAAPDDALDYKKMVRLMAELDPVHQLLLWEVYWEGNSMRTVATDWEVDELSVIREHKSLILFLQKGFAKSKSSPKLKVRPALKETSLKLKKKGAEPPFSKMAAGGAL